eukprot:gene25611-34177_t
MTSPLWLSLKRKRETNADGKDVLLSKTKFESADSVGDNENYNKENENDNITHRPLIELSRNDILGLLDSMPQYKSTFSISKVTGSVLSNCSSVKHLQEIGILKESHAKELLEKVLVWKDEGVPVSLLRSSNNSNIAENRRFVSLKHLERSDNDYNEKNSSSAELEFKKRKCNFSSSFWESNNASSNGIKDMERWESTDRDADDTFDEQSLYPSFSSSPPSSDTNRERRKPKLMSLQKTKAMLMHRHADKGKELLQRHPFLLTIPIKDIKEIGDKLSSSSDSSVKNHPTSASSFATIDEEGQLRGEEDTMESEIAVEENILATETVLESSPISQHTTYNKRASLSPTNLYPRRESLLEYIVDSTQFSPAHFNSYKESHSSMQDIQGSCSGSGSGNSEAVQVEPKALEQELESCTGSSFEIVPIPRELEDDAPEYLARINNSKSADEIIISFHDIFSALLSGEKNGNESDDDERGSALLLATLRAINRVCDIIDDSVSCDDIRASKRALLDHGSFFLMIAYLLSLNKNNVKWSRVISEGLFLAVISLCRRDKLLDSDSPFPEEDSWFSIRSFAVDDYAIAKLGDLHYHDIVADQLVTHFDAIPDNHDENEYVRLAEYGLYAMRYLSVNVENAIKMVSPDTITQSAAAKIGFSILMRYAEKSEIVARNGLNFLCNLCCDADCISHIGSLDACEVVIATLSGQRNKIVKATANALSDPKMVSEDSVVEAALEAIAILACRSTNNGKLGKIEACELCISLLGYYCTGAFINALNDNSAGFRSRIIVNGLSALINLSCDSENNMKLGAAGACELCVTVLAELTNLSILPETGAVDTASRELLIGKVLFAIRNLASDYDNNIKFASHKSCETVLHTILFQFSQHVSSNPSTAPTVVDISCIHVWQQAFCAIRTLSRHSENNIKLGTPVACDAYVKLLDYCLLLTTEALPSSAIDDICSSNVEIYTLIYEVFFALHSITRASSICKSFGIAGKESPSSVCDSIINVMSSILFQFRSTGQPHGNKEFVNNKRLSLPRTESNNHLHTNADGGDSLQSALVCNVGSNQLSNGLEPSAASKIVEQGMIIIRNVLLNNKEDVIAKDSTKESISHCCVAALQVFGHVHSGIAKRCLHIMGMLVTYGHVKLPTLTSHIENAFDYSSELGRIGACEVTVQLMKMYYSNGFMINSSNIDATLALHGLIVMRHLAGNAINRAVLIRVGAIDVCLHLLNMFPDKAVSVEVSYCLKNISEGFASTLTGSSGSSIISNRNSYSGIVSLRDNDAITQSVATLITTFGAISEEVAENGLKTLLNLMYGCDQQKINGLLLSCMEGQE